MCELPKRHLSVSFFVAERKEKGNNQLFDEEQQRRLLRKLHAHLHGSAQAKSPVFEEVMIAVQPASCFVYVGRRLRVVCRDSKLYIEPVLYDVCLVLHGKPNLSTHSQATRPTLHERETGMTDLQGLHLADQQG